MKNLVTIFYKFRYIILIISQIVFFFIYKLVLEDYFLKVIRNFSESLDLFYYLKIFIYLPRSIFVSILILSIIILLRERILNSLLKLDEKLFITLLLVFYVVIQVNILLFIKTVPYSDSKRYLELAENLFISGSYINEYGNKTAFYPVGLPALLCLLKKFFDDMIIAGRILNIIFSTGTMFFIYKVFRLMMSRKELYIFLLTYFLFPNNFFSVNPILTEQGFTFLIWLLIYLFVNHKKYFSIVGGLILGLMLYFRSYSLLILGVIFIYYLKEKMLLVKLREIFLMAILMVFMILPWIARNYQVFNSFVPMTTNDGFNFLMGNHKNSLGNINFNFEYNISNPNEAEESKKAYLKAFRELKENPIKLLYLIPFKLFHTYKRGDVYITWSLKQTENELNPLFVSVMFYLTNLIFYFVLIIGTMKLFLINNFTMHQKFFIYLLISFIIVCLVYVGNERYILPVLPIHFYFFSLNVEESY